MRSSVLRVSRLPLSLIASALVVAMLLLLPRGAAGFDLKLDIGGPTLPGEASPSFLAGHDVPYEVRIELDLDELFDASVAVELEGPGSFVTRSIVGIPVGPDGVSFGPIRSSRPHTDVTISGDVTHASIAADVFTGYGYGFKGLASPASITIDGTLSLPADAPSGEYRLRFTVDNGRLPGAPQTATVKLTVRPFLTTTLAQGWNTFSIPILAERSTTAGRFYATENLGTAAQNGLVDPDKVEQAFRFDAEAQEFVLIVIDEASNNAPLLPLEAIYVESNSAHDATLIFEDDQSGPPSRRLSADWNLVGLAVGLGTTTKQVDQALISVRQTASGLVGYSIVVSPAINPDTFAWTIAESPVGVDLTRSLGYWVFMESADTLAGFSTTPVEPPPPPKPGAGNFDEEWAALIAAAQAEGELVLAMGGGAGRNYRPVAEFFSEKFGVPVVVSTGSGGAQVNRILAEREAKQFTVDIVFVGATSATTRLVPANALVPIADLFIHPEVADESLWFGGKHHYTDVEQQFVFTTSASAGPIMPMWYNTDNVSQADLDAIDSVFDYLDPKWKGKIVALSPLTGGAGETYYKSYVHPDIGPEWIEQFVSPDLDVTFVEDFRTIVDGIAKGAFALGIAIGSAGRDLDLLNELGFPVERFPCTVANVCVKELKEAGVLTGGSSVNNIMVPTDQPHPNATKLFVNWFLSKEGQRIMHTLSAEAPDQTLRTDVTDLGKTLPFARRDPDRNYLFLSSDPAFTSRRDEALQFARDAFNATHPPAPPPGSQEFPWEPLFGPCPAPCFIASTLSIEDGKFEFRVGDAPMNPDGLFGYPQGARVPSIIPGGIVIGPMEVGTTFRFNVVRMSGSRSTKDHYFIVEGLGVREEFSLDGNRVIEPWEYTFTEAGEFAITSGDASGDDPPEEHGPAKFVIVEGEAAFDGTYVLGDFVVEDGKFELRMGDTAYWGYDAEARIPTIAGLVEIIIGPIQVGETVSFDRCRQSGSRSTVTHHMTVEALGIDHNLDDGRFGADPPGGAVGVAGDPNNNCEFTFTAPGVYIIDDSTDQGAHGVAKFVVEGEATFDGTYVLDQFVVEDGKFELRMADTAYWGYDAFQRIPTIAGLLEIVMGPIQVGETVSFARCRQSGSRSTKPHHMIVEGLGIDHNLDVGTGGGPVGDSGDPNNNCEFTFTAPGVYIIDDSTDPGAHGVAKFIVEAVGPVVYVLDEIRVRDAVFELRMGETIAWGYGAGGTGATPDRIRTDEVGDIIITINVGDSLVFPDGLTGSGSSTATHFITIDEFGINAEIPPGVDTNPGLTITPTQAGTFRLYCSLHPDPSVHGNFFIVVEGVGPTPTVYEIDEINMEDGLFELRMAGTPYWGYDAEQRLKSNEVEIVITINVGDSIVLEDGFNVSSSRSTKDHHFTITELGIDILGVVGARDIMPGFTITPTEAGTFIMHDSSDPDGHGIPMKLIVL